MNTGMDLNGVVCAAVTPLDEQGCIDTDLLDEHCSRMFEAGCSFVSVFGTTGEGVSFSVRERVAALEALAKQGADMSRHIPGVMVTSVDDAAVLYQTISRLGCRAALIIPPFYYSPTPSGVADFYEAVIKKAGAPQTDIVLYNIPQFSGVALTPEVVRLVVARCGGRIAGVKDSTGNLDDGMALINAFPELSIFTGDDRILTRMVAAGGAGMIGGMPNLYTADCLKLFENKAADAVQQLAKKRIETVDQNGGLVILKALLAKQYGNDAFARVAPPVSPAPEELIVHISETLAVEAEAIKV